MNSLHEWLGCGPFTLALSAGYFGMYAHVGFLCALEEAGLRPARITGASGGALAGAAWAAGAEGTTLGTFLRQLRKEDFWDPAFGPGLLRGERFRAQLSALAPVTRLEDCPLPIAVSAFDIKSRKTHILTTGPFAGSVYASCAVPFLFQPIRLGTGYYLDGGILDRPGLAGAVDQPRILYHHILPQRSVRHLLRSAAQIPTQAGLQAVVIHGLPRLGPDRLHLGEMALLQAQAAMRQALARPVHAQGTTLHLRDPIDTAHAAPSGY